jgi:predicted metal-dependent hydrolase
MQAAKVETLLVGGKQVLYRVLRSRYARKLRVRVGPGGIEVVHPTCRTDEELAAFVDSSAPWIASQIERVERLRHVRRPIRTQAGQMLVSVHLPLQETAGRACPRRGNALQPRHDRDASATGARPMGAGAGS